MTTPNLDSLLDLTLDDLSDMPSFENFCPGTHLVSLSLEWKDINGKTAVEAKIKLIETLEQADPSTKAPSPDDECNTAYMMDNEYGQGKFKVIAAPIAVQLGITNLVQLVEEAKNLECVVVTGLRTDKKDLTRNYLDIKSLAFV